MEQLPLKEKIYLRKDFLGYRIVHPIRNEDGSINWFNAIFGGKRNLVLLIFMLLLFALFAYGVYELTSSMRDVVENPCDYCPILIHQNPANTGLDLNLEGVKIE